MKERQKLHNLLDKQKIYLQEYEKTLKEIDAHDLVNENETLKEEVKKYKNIIDEIKIRNNELLDENTGLKSSLKEQILDEKLNILRVSREKLNLYFKSLSEEYSNGLLQLEGEASKKIEHLRNIAYREMLDINDEFYAQLDALKNELKEKVSGKRNSFNDEREKFYYEVDDKINYYANQEINDELVEKRKRQNDFEIKIGLNWINKIGILLILIGVSYAFKYSYTAWFTKEMKGILGFVIGALFLGAGEWFYQKGKDVFSKGLIGGGVGILYFAIFHSHFNLQLIGMFTALIICVLVALVTLLLSIRYDSQTIGSFALIGGFLPFFTYVFQFGLTEESIVYVMGYLVILNLLLLSISFNKGWSVIKFISFTLNIPSLIYLIGQTPQFSIKVLYTVITFAMYLFITLAYPFRHKIKLAFQDIMLLGLNTFISCLLIYFLFDQAHLAQYRGLLALGFCLVYFGLGQFISKTMKEEVVTQGIFYLTALTFAVLIIPFQFSWKWVVVGWMIEGTLLTIYGFRNKILNAERAGWVIVALCTAAFYITSLEHLITKTDIHFDIKYITFIVGITAILFAYLFKLEKNILDRYSFRGEFIRIYKYFTLMNIWAYGIYIINRLFNLYIKDSLMGFDAFYKILLFVLVTIIIAFVISNIKVLYDDGVRALAIIMYGLVDFVCIVINTNVPLPQIEHFEAIRNISLIILIAYNIFVFFNIRWLTLKLLEEIRGNLEIYPLALGVYLFGTLTVLLDVQFDLGHINLLFSLLYVGLAFVYIAYGFIKNYTYIRRFGLGVLVFATSKLFIYDLSHLEIGGKIVAYFGFGLTMLAISFIYQKLKESIQEVNHTEHTL